MSGCDAFERIPSYGKIFSLGHKALHGTLFDGPVVVEEKVDGSQFSWMLTTDGDLLFRSRGAAVRREDPGMFAAGVDAIEARRDRLQPGAIYRGEYLSKPKHNALEYGRVPRGHVVLWDVELPVQRFESPDTKARVADECDLEAVPLLHVGEVGGVEAVESLLERESFLGGAKIEGIVVKNYARFGEDGKIVKGKYVSEAFKEVHRKSWKKSNPTQTDILLRLGEMFQTEARWAKAVQRLRDGGELEGSPRDIGRLIAEVKADVEAECEDLIKDELYKWARGHVLRRCTGGLPEWYKRQLLGEAFE